MEDSDLKDGHPAKKPDFEEKQRQKIRFGRAVQRLGPILASHRRNGEVLEEDAESDRKRKI